MASSVDRNDNNLNVPQPNQGVSSGCTIYLCNLCNICAICATKRALATASDQFKQLRRVNSRPRENGLNYTSTDYFAVACLILSPVGVSPSEYAWRGFFLGAPQGSAQ